MSDGGDDDDDRPAPFADLVRAVEDDGAGDDDVWSQFDVVDDEGSDGADVWRRLAEREGEPRTVEGAHRRRFADRTPAWATISTGAKLLQGALAALCLGAAVAIYAAAFFGVIPRRAWMLGLPVFALGVVLVLPILAWYAGRWEPTRLA